MFSKVQLSLAVAALVGNTSALSLTHKKHHRHHEHNLAGVSSMSVPNCTSYECRNNQATIGYAGLAQFPQRLYSKQSDPNWNSASGYEETTAAYPFHLEPKDSLAQSIPACNSHQYHEGKCEKETAAAPLMQVNSIPACNSYQFHEGKCEKETAAAPLMQV